MAMTDTRAPIPRMKAEDRREQILSEAFQLISVGGFNAVSLSDIAKACGIQKSSVLHHFPSMNDLLFAVLQKREEQDYEFYAAQPAQEAPTGPRAARERFTRVFQHNLERHEFVRLYSILSAEALSPDHPAHEYFAMRSRVARGEVARFLEWKDDPALAAAEFLAFWDGLELSWRHDPDLDPLAIWESYCDRFFV
ncbi:TetR/AcrR family transcriptional regulator [Microbacterium sp. ARD31]|uniref:TetR/AcrR family transcriptional regulator n=1 Tax=Microbacterium sp. ARD31 TaxID=2962576 RepID=UPI00288218C4|nr:TetR/AcrR family transcriptional regulator [Microbacterium sp. ARD31]MDT0184031.1 TetR/AcrR family transcriptional regulator [Microbacterium sp. ARD31]